VLTRRPGLTYESLRESFRWRAPSTYNIGADVCDRRPRAAPAVVVSDGRRVTRQMTFGELSEASNRLANALRGLGVGQGERVGVLLPQRPETVVAHIAVYKLGAVAVPLSVLFGPDALAARLADAGVVVVIGEAEPLALLRETGLDVRLVDADRDLPALLAAASASFEPVATTPATPAVLIYTSGTAGAPKGALHGHGVLLGHLPGFELSHDFFPQDGDLIWTPADWAWIGGLYDVLMPALHHGRPVVAFRAGKFDPERAFDLLAHVGVRNAFLPPTALRMMRAVRGPSLGLRSVASGGESLGEEVLEWGRSALGVTIAEFYGQTEANLVLGNCPSLWPVRPGWTGRPYPGHEVRLVEGEIAVRAEGNPVVFLEYWRNPEATAQKVVDGWVRTGDLAEQDGDGSIRFVGRADDVISSGGYRIGPGEIEDCLVRHPSVALAAAVGVPDPVRGQIVKAFVVAAPGVLPTAELTAELQALVRTRLAAYEYPREIEFVESLPTTTTGKIRRAELRRLEAERAAGREAAAG
jgi:acetyl-CoA synthetase